MQRINWMHLMPRNEHPDDIQELINNTPKCKASTAPNDMESGRGGGSGACGSTSSSPISPSDQRAHCGDESSSSASFCGKYFSVESFLLLVCVTASLVILPLILPPLPPPPSMLMLVPVAMLVVLLVLAFMPTSGGRDETGQTYM